MDTGPETGFNKIEKLLPQADFWLVWGLLRER
jgi:hypothetical protein